MNAKKWIETELLPGESILWERSLAQLSFIRFCKHFFGALSWGMFCFCVFCAFGGQVSDVLAPSVTPYVFCLLVVVLLWRAIRYLYCEMTDSLWRFEVLTNYRIIRAERFRGEYLLWSLPLVAVTAEWEQGKAVLHMDSPYTYEGKDKMLVATGKAASSFLEAFRAVRAEMVSLPVPEPLAQSHDLLPDGESLYGVGERLEEPREDLGWWRWLLFWAIWSGAVLVTAWQNPPADGTWVQWGVCGLVLVLSLTLLVLVHRAQWQYKEVWLPFVVGAENVYGKELNPHAAAQYYPLEKILHSDGTASFFFTEPCDYRDLLGLQRVRNHADVGRLLYMLGLTSVLKQTLDTQPHEQ